MTLTPFRNEPYLDFNQPANRDAMQAAVTELRATLGQDHPLLIAGERVTTEDKLRSVNPSNPSELIGAVSKATPELATRALEAAHDYFPEWSRTLPMDRVKMLLRAAELLRERKLHFNAWLCLESGKTWAEAEGETAEAIDFCEYYAREMARLSGPQPVVQMPGERDELHYLPLGVGIIIPPWNFALAILTGMTVAALVAGNTVLIKPSSETPILAAALADLLLEAGFPPKSLSFVPGSGAAIGDLLVQHPKTRFIAFTGSRDVGLRINELAAKTQPGQIWIKRVVAEMGGKDAIIVDAECDFDRAVEGVFSSAFGYQGQKCSACSRAIVHTGIYDKFVQRLQEKAVAVKVGPADDPQYYMGPVISQSAQKSIQNYIEIGKTEGRMVAGGTPVEGSGYFIPPTIIADVDGKARIFQEEIFGPVLAVTRAEDFEHALSLANDSQYGLTGAIFSDNKDHVREARERFFVGNLYVNRKCTGAMVGAHPFGGFNMSGTDSKAGGPDYLLLFLQGKSIAEKVT
ncbi:MAG: L-glutamate gamma-semialdehyde dehydrogenase [Acidobacteriota bacterium]|nr:L-glutamate gamma-semialdehyde dehydrogenase [Acidobacteriota bacterium]